MSARHAASRAPEGYFRIIDGHQVRMLRPIIETCGWLAEGFCAASVDGFCIGGTQDGKCFG